jgi:hypothetical protein
VVQKVQPGYRRKQLWYRRCSLSTEGNGCDSEGAAKVQKEAAVVEKVQPKNRTKQLWYRRCS